MAGSHKIFYVGSPIGSLSALAKTLEVTEKRLLSLAGRGIKNYLVFDKLVKGKNRELAEPFLELKIIQKRILNRIFCHLRYPEYLHGGIKAADPRDFYSNANSHRNAEVAVMMDIKGFFPAITPELVEKTFTLLFKFPPTVSSVLAKLTTLNGQLPQGAPTSTTISNLVMFEQEYKLVSSLEGQGFVYTRLIDDITVSSEKVVSNERLTKIVNRIAKMISSYGFHLHPDKTQVRSRANPKELMSVTGLWLNRGTPKLEKRKRVEISAQVIKLRRKAELHGRFSDDYHQEYTSISGKVALLQRLKHSRALRLRNLLEDIEPIYDDRGVAKIANLVDKFCRRARDAGTVGYIQKFYNLQHRVAVVKRTHVNVARKLQNALNKMRPHKTLKSIYA
ncbi:reverse transcriptase family protein [Telluria sp. Tellsp104]